MKNAAMILELIGDLIREQSRAGSPRQSATRVGRPTNRAGRVTVKVRRLEAERAVEKPAAPENS